MVRFLYLLWRLGIPRGVWLVVYPGVSLCVILATKEEPFSLWRDFGSSHQGISSLKRDLPGLPRWLSGKESACRCRTGIWSLVWEDPTCLRATQPVRPNCWACALEPRNHNYWVWKPRACAQQQEKPLQWEAHTPQLQSSLWLLQLEKSPCSKEGPAQPNNK